MKDACRVVLPTHVQSFFLKLHHQCFNVSDFMGMGAILYSSLICSQSIYTLLSQYRRAPRDGGFGLVPSLRRRLLYHRGEFHRRWRYGIQTVGEGALPQHDSIPQHGRRHGDQTVGELGRSTWHRRWHSDQSNSACFPNGVVNSALICSYCI